MTHNGMDYEEYIEWAQEAFGCSREEAQLYADDAFGLNEPREE